MRRSMTRIRAQTGSVLLSVSLILSGQELFRTLPASETPIKPLEIGHMRVNPQIAFPS